MTLLFVRCFFLVISGALGYYVGFLKDNPIMGGVIGLLSGLLLIFFEKGLRRVSVRGLSSMLFGLLLGILMAKLVSDVLELMPLDTFYQSVSRVVLTIIFSYIGAVMALRGKDEFNIIIPYVKFKRQDVREGIILLDTSAIIDGRVADIYKHNFLPGRLVVPKFILDEIQRLADSSDDIKRQRGRRGMELLRMMQKDPDIDISVQETEEFDDRNVDRKLIDLAKLIDARICTTDFNLAEIARLQSVEVLNIRELINAIKPFILTGETLQVKLVREGKEQGQALAFTEEGTMIVVNNAREFIGQEKKIVVTSILQTQAGRIIFADLAE